MPRNNQHCSVCWLPALVKFVPRRSSYRSSSRLVLMRLPQCEIVITARSNAGSQRAHLSKHALTFVRSLVAQTFANRDIPRGGGIDFTIHGAIAGGRMRVPVLSGWLELVLGMNLGLAYLETDEMIAVTSGRPVKRPARGSTAPIRFERTSIRQSLNQ